ncbi:Uu.00g105700.m01.CDS01 [Anthostomella pinea]|uniref:Uu.00g105700.m01.CDS01 n=1 Tax=Anthostomella pinea TaxID=933095 RepID=A0AAI8YDE5_9PEZI|nr:Uu.00g105700.m01.CDS01 [Anthostomella pinea]
MGLLALKKPEQDAGKAWPAIVIGLFVAFGGVLFGYDTGTISGILAMDYWQNLFSTGYVNTKGHLDVSPSQSSAIVSILSAGTFFGSLSSPLLADSIGRRLALIMSSLVFVLGVILQTAATALPLFLAGRFFAGFGVGLISALIPLYQSETAPKWIRGAIVGAYQFAITIGLLLANIVDNSTQNRQDTGSYRIPIAVQFAWAIILIGGMLILPETPRFLIKKGDHAKAARALGQIRRIPADHPAVLAELAEIQANHDFEMTLGKASYLDCFRGPMLKRQLTGMGLQALQQLTGINFIFYYGTQYFKNSGISNSFTIQIITSVVNVVSTLPGLWAVDKFGRRPLLLWGAIGMCVSQFLVAVLGTTTTGQDASGNILVYNVAAQKAGIAFVCIYIFFFASTWGPLAWVVTGEIFPLKTRAKSLGMATATNWLLNWAIAYATPYLVNYGPGYANLQSKIFFIWFGCCFICIAFVYFYIYETKGLSLEEVDELYTEVKSARKSKDWVPSRSFAQRQSVSGGVGEKDGATTHHSDLVFVELSLRARDDPNLKVLRGFHEGSTEGSRQLMAADFRNGVWATLSTVAIESVHALDEDVLVGKLGYKLRELGTLSQLIVPFGGLLDIGLKYGETVLIAPATGSFGSAAVHVALSMGARVIVMGRNETSLEGLKKLAEPGRVETVRINGDAQEDVKALAKFGPLDVFFDISPAKAAKSSHIKAGITHKGLTIKGTFVSTTQQATELIKTVERGVLKIGSRAGMKVMGKLQLENWEKAFEVAALESGPGKSVYFIPNGE